MRLSALSALALVLLAIPARAQELNCTVTVNRQAIAGNDYAFLDEFRDEVERYLNARAWTDDVVAPRERIDCGLQVTITDALSLTSFRAKLVVQASRPIYGTGLRTPTAVIGDESWTFTYNRGQALVFDPNRYDRLTSVLDFYAYVILGYDYDSFAEMGGTPYFEAARKIAEIARQADPSQEAGWGGQITDERSRYGLVQDLLDPAFAALRRAQFTYHYTVLDHFVLQPEQAWDDTMTMLAALHEMYQQLNRRRYGTDVFFATKYQEIVNLLADAPQRTEAYALLTEMDAAHRGTYDALVNRR